MEEKSEDKVTVEQLPAEMLLHVFSFLNTGDLKRSALVCKKWNGVITQNGATMRHLPLHLEGSWLRLKQNTKDFRNKYHTISIEGAYEWTNNAVDIMHRHGRDARLLNLKGCSFDCNKLNVIGKMFHPLSKLEKIKIVDTDFATFDDVTGIKAVSLPELKSVVLHESNLAILKFIKDCQLTSLKVNFEYEGAMTESFVDFLVGQDRLEEFAICGASIFSDSIDGDKIKAMKFPLKRLALHKIANFLGSEENTLMFLNQFSDTLEELELGNKFPMSVYEMIFKKLKKLKVLSVCLASAPDGRDFYRKMRANTSIKRLIVKNFEGASTEQLHGIIGNLPRIETLELMSSCSVPNDLMVFISNNLRMLKHLKLETINGSLLRNVRFGSLTSITVKNIEEDTTVEDWKTIVKAIPNVEKISIEYVEHKDSIGFHAFKIITKALIELSHIRIGNGFVAARNIFKKLLYNCKHLRTVEIPAEAKVSNAILREFKKEGPRLVLLSEDEMREKFKMEDYGMWLEEDLEDEIFPYEIDESVDDSDAEDDEDSDVDGLDVFNMMFGMMGELGYDSDYSDNQYIYFDSDGEMANWMDDGGYDGENNFFDLD